MKIIFFLFTESTDDVKVFTIASQETEGYQRYIRSAEYHNIEVRQTAISSIRRNSTDFSTVFFFRRWKHWDWTKNGKVEAWTVMAVAIKLIYYEMH